MIEPEHYMPVIPMLLVNGAEGIGTGWSSSIKVSNEILVIIYHYLLCWVTQHLSFCAEPQSPGNHFEHSKNDKERSTRWDAPLFLWLDRWGEAQCLLSSYQTCSIRAEIIISRIDHFWSRKRQELHCSRWDKAHEHYNSPYHWVAHWTVDTGL